ncbi:hypothetical protein [Haloferula rosea]|uniref:Uncharacterized protein n=1 Tax=Haloferula rosea TaxID=490093 RepID=A0A934RES3_9BACT|nr:hypothetical protein [Haloferula rosea]MBK1828207.1 hypothetical protein [Haloferula rosea]
MAAILAFFVLAGAVVVATRRDGIHRTKERRAWKDSAIEQIRKDLENPDFPIERFGRVPQSLGEFAMSDPNWLTSDTMVFRDGAWLVYRAQTHKVDPKVHDIFIAKASDGHWYFSDYHFCVGMMVLSSEEQPESLEAFREACCLARFDGTSDDALNSTTERRGRPDG